MNPAFMGRTGSPLSIASLAAWYWANALGFKDTGAITPVAVDSDNVALRKDLSGNGRDMSQATGSTQPLWKLNQQNGFPADQFDGVDDVLAFAGAGLGQPAWEFVAFKLLATPAGNHTVIDGAAQNQSRIYVNAALGINVFAGAGLVDSIALSTGTMYIVASRFNGASSSLQVNNRTVITGDAGASAVTGLRTGSDGSQFCNCQVFERIRYQRDLAQAEADFVRNLLNARYGAW